MAPMKQLLPPFWVKGSSFVEIAETVAAVIKDFEKVLHQVDVPSFLQIIRTLEDAEHADKWGRKQASKILESII